MTDTGDNISIHTRTDAGVPVAPRLGSSSSSSASRAGGRSYSSAAGGRAATLGGRSTQAEALGQAQASKVSEAPDNTGAGLGDQDSIANSTIQSRGSIPPAPPFATINLAPSVQGGGSGGGLGGKHVGAGGKTRIEMLFSAAQDTPDCEIEQETGVILPRDERGKKGTSDYKKNRAAATDSIEHKFGVAKHYVSSLDGEAEEGDATKNRYIQEAYVANLAKSDDFNTRLIQFDLKYIFLMSSLKTGIDPTTQKNPKDLWEVGTEVDMIDSWERTDWEQACYWQYSINKRGDDRVKETASWAQSLSYNSCTASLREQIDMNYKKLHPAFQGAITYVWIKYKCMFARSRDTTASLKTFFKITETKGLGRIPGENVVYFAKEILAVGKRLHISGDLPEETIVDVLTGLTKCSCKPFRTVFESYLQDAIKKSLEITAGGLGATEDTYDAIYDILHKAVEFYHSLNTSNKWSVVKGHKFSAVGTGCWNCGKDDCHTSICKEPLNEERIEKAKKEHYARKREQREQGGRGGRGRGGGGRTGSEGRGGAGRGSGGYSRNKWGAPKPGEPNIRMVKGKWCAWCKEGCGWNPTHSTKYHEKAMGDNSWSIKKLESACPKHPLVMAIKAGSNSTPAKEGASPGQDASDGGGENAGTGSVAVNTGQAKTILTQLERGAVSDEARSMIESLRTGLGLN